MLRWSIQRWVVTIFPNIAYLDYSIPAVYFHFGAVEPAKIAEIVDPTMGGEDFSEYSLPDRSIPAVNFHFGAVEPAKMAGTNKREKNCQPCIRVSSHPFPNQRSVLGSLE